MIAPSNIWVRRALGLLAFAFPFCAASPSAGRSASGAERPVPPNLTMPFADPLLGAAGLRSPALQLHTDLAAGAAKAGATPEKAARAAKATPARKKASKPFVTVKAIGEFHSIYDNNIFRYSEQNLLAFRRGETPWKFGMDTYDDFILSPRLTLDFGRRVFGSKTTTFRVKYTLWRYSSNPEKSNDQWFLRLRQPLRSRDAMELSYTYAPPAFVRKLSDRPPYESRVVPLVWIDFKGTRNAFALAYSGRLSDRLSYRAELGRVLRFYNKPFLENDNWEWNRAATATVRLSGRWTASGKYQYSNSRARGLDTTTETKETSNDGDGSYERDLYQVSLGFSPPRKLWKLNRIDLMGQQQIYWYTSRRPYFEDPTHTGRKDTVWAVEAIVGTRPVYGPVTTEIGWRHTRRSSTSAATLVGADDIEEDKRYSNDRFWVGLSYPF